MIKKEMAVYFLAYHLIRANLARAARLHHKIPRQLYSLKEIHTECPECRHQFDRQVQKGVDVGIATLIVKLAAQRQYERILLSAGDGDFEDAIAFTKDELHKEFWLSGFDGTVSADRQSYADQMIWLDDFWEDIEKA